MLSGIIYSTLLLIGRYQNKFLYLRVSRVTLTHIEYVCYKTRRQLISPRLVRPVILSLKNYKKKKLLKYCLFTVYLTKRALLFLNY